MLTRTNQEPLYTSVEPIEAMSPKTQEIMVASCTSQNHANTSALQENTAPNRNVPSWLAEMNNKHAVVRNRGKVSVMNFEVELEIGGLDISFSKVNDFKNFYLNKFDVDDSDGIPKKNFLAQRWLTHSGRREYTSLVFAPGKLPELPGRAKGEVIYNLFRGFAVQPKAGDCSLFWSHVEVIICNGNKKLYSFVRKWMAHAIQKPWQMPGTALVMRGGQGVGKGTVAMWLRALFKANFVTVTQPSHFTGKFNAHMAQALVVFADEVVWGGNKECAGALKAMITEAVQNIEFKGQDVIPCANFRRFIISSNEDWCVPVEVDDRRLVVLDVSDQRKGDKAYFKELYEQMKTGGLEALMYDLTTEDLNDFDHNFKPEVVNNGQFQLKLLNMNATTAFWHEYLSLFDTTDLNNGWNPIVSKEDLHEEYLDWCKRKTWSHPDRTLATFGKNLAAMVDLKSTRLSATNIGSGTISASIGIGTNGRKRVQMYEFPELAVCRAQFEHFVHEGTYIWDK